MIQCVFIDLIVDNLTISKKIWSLKLSITYYEINRVVVCCLFQLYSEGIDAGLTQS